MTRQEDTSAGQDAFAELVEDCRIGTVRRITLIAGPPAQTKYTPFKPDLELTNLPVFDLGMMGEIFTKEMATGLQACVAGQFRLPYPRCGFIYRGIGTEASQARIPHPHRKVMNRYYFMICDEDDDGVLINSFVRHDDHDHWSVQTWQALVTSGASGEVVIAYDEHAIKGGGAEFKSVMDEANNNRIAILLGDIHRLTTTTGSVTHGKGSLITTKIDVRRKRLALPEIPRVRIVTFDGAPTPIVSGPSMGGTKAPHYRRGAWRTLPSGRETWVRASAIHGGSPERPPWYEVRH